MPDPQQGPPGRPAPVEFLPLDPQHPDEWNLTPDYALVHRELKTAVIADVHLGYEWARGSRGDVVPAHSLRETLEKLERLTNRLPIRQLVVAGDLIESALPCARTRQDVAGLAKWLVDRKIELIHIHGNHEGTAPTLLPLQIEMAGWSIAHGHQHLGPGRWIIGYHHPALHIEEISAPCYLLHENWVILPAFSSNAAGLDVLGNGLPMGFRKLDFQCVVPMEGRLFDFGRVSAIRTVFRPASNQK